MFGNLRPGTYDVAEAAADGWSQGAATCSDGSNPASVSVDPGEDVICTFENQKLDTITGDGGGGRRRRLPFCEPDADANSGDAGGESLRAAKRRTARAWTP